MSANFVIAVEYITWKLWPGTISAEIQDVFLPSYICNMIHKLQYAVAKTSY